MSISSVGSSAAAYTPTSQSSTDDAPAPPPAASADKTRPSTTLTLSDGTVSEVSVYSGTLKSMPMSVAAAPQLFVQADTNHDNTLSLEEFTDQLKRVGVNSDTAKQLFDSINSSKSGELSIDDFVKGVVATNAKGNGVFQDLLTSYTSGADGKFSPEAFDAFMAQGATVATQYWTAHPELQQR